MGVDYTGHYGIGVQVSFENLQEEIASEYNIDVDDVRGYELDYLDTILIDTEYAYFEVGSGSYTGKRNDIYVCMTEPFKGGYDITNEVKKFEDFLDSVGLVRVGDTDVVGGLNVW